MIFQSTFFEFLIVTTAFGSIIFIFMYFVFKVLKQERKWMNYQFSGVLISASIGLILNIVSRPIPNMLIRETIYKFTIYFLAYSPIFLLTFCASFINSMKGKDFLSIKKQVVIIVLYGIILSFTFLIPNGVTIFLDRPTELSFPYYLYFIVGLSIGAVIPLYYLALGVVYKDLENERLKKKWKIFMVGTTMLLSEIYSILTSNTFYISSISTIVLIINFILSLSGAYLIYYGVGKEFKS